MGYFQNYPNSNIFIAPMGKFKQKRNLRKFNDCIWSNIICGAQLKYMPLKNVSRVSELTIDDCYKAFRYVETLFVQGRNLYLAGLLLVGGK